MSKEEEIPRFRELRFVLGMILRDKLAVLSLAVIISFYLIALLAPWISPYDPNTVSTTNRVQLPSWEHLLGTDAMGRDVFSRLLWGAKPSLTIGFLVVGITTLIGVPLGSIAGYLGGKTDEIIMRITDIFMAFPGLTLAVIFAFLLGRGLFSTFLALSLVAWTRTARVVRSTVLIEKEKEYVTAARALGKNDLQILFQEILPNSINPVIVMSTMRLGTTIIWAAGLSFIGVGIQPPTPDWGNMMFRGLRFLLVQPYMTLMPGLMVIIAVLAFNNLGDTLRDALDPRLRRQIT